MRFGRPTKYEDEMCKRVIELGREGASLTQMAAELGISRETFYVWIDTRDSFSDAVKEAHLLAQAWWEQKGQDATFGKVPGFNALSYIFQMKNRFRHDWRESQHIEQNISGLPQTPIGSINFKIIDAKSMATDDLETLAEILDRHPHSEIIDHEQSSIDD
jgi:AcrR family transcriptional regulator